MTISRSNFLRLSKSTLLCLSVMLISDSLYSEISSSDDLRCISLTAKVTFCKVANDTGEYKVLTNASGKTFSWNTFSGNSFSVRDIFGNGTLFAMIDRLNISNGIGFEDFGIYLFSNVDPIPLVILSSSDWSDSCIHSGVEGTVHLNIPEWTDIAFSKFQQVQALVIRPYIFSADGQLIPNPSEPIRFQRLTRKFEKLRDGSGSAIAVGFVQSHGAIAAVDPVLSRSINNLEPGLIDNVNVRLDLDDPKVEIDIQINGNHENFELLPSVDFNREIVRLGEITSHRLYPRGYVPVSTIQNWKGRKVRLEKLIGSDRNPVTVVWF
jgi:hypothetical protein